MNWKTALWAAVGAGGGVLLLRAIMPKTSAIAGAAVGAALAAGLTTPAPTAAPALAAPVR